MIFCAIVPLKFTVLGPDVAASSIPAVNDNVLAIPSIELADNCNEVPLMVTLNRFAVPLNDEVPVNVAVPEVAEKVPLTTTLVETEKSASVVIDPVTDNWAKLLVPAPEIVFVVPLMLIIPALADRLPLTNKLPEITKEADVVTEPLTLKLSIEMPVPLIVLPVPVINNVPPEACTKEPDDMVARLPDRVTLLFEKVINDAAMVRLLKFCTPVPLIFLPGPLKVMVPVLPLKIPLFTQLPPMIIE